ncbi:MAG: CHASE2 domain-containing protein, partial [Xenococcus sp. (in: cyanobacteria)]
MAIFFTSFLITGIIIGVKQWGGLENSELVAYDEMVRLKSGNRFDERLLLVEITDLDIKNQKRWPIDDQTIAQLLAEIQKYQPKVIGLDLYRDITYPPGTASLNQQLQAENLIAIEYLGHGDNRVAAPKVVPPSQVGFNDVVLDQDSVLRRNLLYARLEEDQLYSFAFRLTLEYLKDFPEFENNLEIVESLDSLTVGNTVLPRLQANSGGYQMHPNEALGWQMLIDYQSRIIAPTVTLTEVLEGKLNSDLVKDKVVIIGTTAPSIKDFFYTPYQGEQATLPGALAHAQMVSQLISLILGESTQIWFWSEGVESLWIWAWSLVGLAISLKLRHPLSIALTTIAVSSLLYGICLVVFLAGGWIPWVPSLLSLLVTVVFICIYRVVYNTLYDSLTALPNSTLFMQQLRRLNHKYLHNNSSLSIVVFCLDLDRFKLINDGLGYQIGDQLLLATTRHLQNYITAENLLARVGGDEFAIAMVIEEDPSLAIKIANKLQETLTVPFYFDNREILNSVTIGIAINDITSDFIPENILRSARTAMYKAKASGKIRHEIFAQKMHKQALIRLELETDLYQALKNQEFQLYYQPIISLKTHKVAGFEALVRWISPVKGFISPGEFIPIAEETGAIIPLGEWIFQEACHQMYL